MPNIPSFSKTTYIGKDVLQKGKRSQTSTKVITINTFFDNFYCARKLMRRKCDVAIFNFRGDRIFNRGTIPFFVGLDVFPNTVVYQTVEFLQKKFRFRIIW